MSASTPTPLSNLQQVKERIAELEVAINTSLPGYKDALRTIHSILKNDADLPHLLSEEEIGIVLVGLAKHKNIVIATSVSRSTATRGKKGSAVTEADI